MMMMTVVVVVVFRQPCVLFRFSSKKLHASSKLLMQLMTALVAQFVRLKL